MNTETTLNETSRAEGQSLLNDGLCVDDGHDWEYHESTFGDHEVINGTGTERWLQCSICGETKPATYADMPDYDEYY
jgi:hypothetical protein